MVQNVNQKETMNTKINGYFEFQNIWKFSAGISKMFTNKSRIPEQQLFLVLVWLSGKNSFIFSPLGFDHKKVVEHQ